MEDLAKKGDHFKYLKLILFKINLISISNLYLSNFKMEGYDEIKIYFMISKFYIVFMFSLCMLYLWTMYTQYKNNVINGMI